MSTSGPASRRDGQIRSAFTTILETLLASSAHTVATVLADEEGEAVDHAGELPAYDKKLAAAHWQIVLRRCSESPGLGEVRRLVIRAERMSYVVHKLYGGYVLLMVCTPFGASYVSERALRQAEVELSHEAGFPLHDEHSPSWTRVRVLLDQNKRPRALWRPDEPPESLQILEDINNLGMFERGHRVRSEACGELQLVREPTGVWFAGQ